MSSVTRSRERGTLAPERIRVFQNLPGYPLIGITEASKRVGTTHVAERVALTVEEVRLREAAVRLGRLVAG